MGAPDDSTPREEDKTPDGRPRSAGSAQHRDRPAPVPDVADETGRVVPHDE